MYRCLPSRIDRSWRKALAKDPNHRPGRLYDLLPPEDAPRSPDVRIIGDGKAGGRSPQDDVLRIEAEEPIFYIGPETRPPRAVPMQAGIRQRIRANLDALRRPGCYPVRNQPVRPVAGRAGSQRCGAQGELCSSGGCGTCTPRRHLPPPEPPPEPSGRVRVAELTSSMLWAAPLLALLMVPAPSLLEHQIRQTIPSSLRTCSGWRCSGTWTVLIPNKVIEMRRFDRTTKRLIALGGGLLLGCAGTCARQERAAWRARADTRSFPSPENLETVYFGGLYALMTGWLPVTVRDRKARFRFGPIMWTALLAAMLTPFWPFEGDWDGMYIAVLIASAVQLVSPWNEPAAAYAQYVRAIGKAKTESRAASGFSCPRRARAKRSERFSRVLDRGFTFSTGSCWRRDWTPMKRLILLIVVAMLAYWVWSRERSALMRPSAPPGYWNAPRYVHDREARSRLAKARREVGRAWQDAKHEIRDAAHKTHDDVHRAVKRCAARSSRKMATMATSVSPRSSLRLLSVRKPRACRCPSCQARG